MDIVLTVLFYIYLGLFLSAPFLLVPAIFMCRLISNPWWKGWLCSFHFSVYLCFSHAQATKDVAQLSNIKSEIEHVHKLYSFQLLLAIAMIAGLLLHCFPSFES